MSRLFVTALFVCTLIGCSSSPSSSSSSNALTTAYPTDLAITSPFATGAALEGLVKLNPGRTTAASATPSAPASYDSIKSAIATKIDTIDINSCGFRVRLFEDAPAANCYGPSVDYQHHPDFALPISGGFTRSCPAATSSQLCDNGQLPGGDVGIWNENEPGTSEACVSRKMNSLVAQVQNQVNLALGLITSVMCAAHAKGEDALPAAGETKDFAAALTEALGKATDKFTINAATLNAATATAGTIYTFAINTSVTVTTPNGNKIVTIDLHLKHQVTDEAAGTYKGRLWYTVSGDVPSGAGGCFSPTSAPGAPALFAISVLYNKNAGNQLKYRLQRAHYCSASADPFDANYNIDGANTFERVSKPGGWAGDYNDAVFNLDTTDGSGTVSFAWQAGSGDDHTRVFLANVSGGATPVGCGYFGFGPPASSPDVGTIDRMICNWAGPSNSHTGLPKVQRQCVTFDSTSSIFITNPSIRLKLSYSPQNSCVYDGVFNNGYGQFSFNAVGDALGSVAAVPDNLLPIATMNADATAPTKPDDF